MSASDFPRPHPHSEAELMPAEEPLGLKKPLLPTKPLGVNQQFLVPLGARSLCVLDPSLSSPSSIQADFLDNTFQNSPFFPTPEPSTETSSAAVEPNVTSTNRTTASSPSSAPSRSLPSFSSPLFSSSSSSIAPPSRPTTEASVPARKSPESLDNDSESTALQEIHEPLVNSETSNFETLQSDLEETQLQQSTATNKASEPIQSLLSHPEISPFLSKSGNPSAISDFLSNKDFNHQIIKDGEAKSNSIQPSLSEQLTAEENTATSSAENSMPSVQAKTIEASSHIESNNQITESSKVQSDPVQPPLTTKPAIEENGSQASLELLKTSAQVETTESISNQSTSVEIQQKEESISATQSQNIEKNIIQAKLEALPIDAQIENSAQNKTTASNSDPSNSYNSDTDNLENLVPPLQQPECFEATDSTETVAVQPHLEASALDAATQQFNGEPLTTASNLSQTPDLLRQVTEQTTEPLLRSPSEQASVKISNQDFSTPLIQPSPDNSQPTSTPARTQGFTVSNPTNNLQSVSQPEELQSEFNISSTSSSTSNVVKPISIPVSESTEGSQVQRQPELASFIEDPSNFNNESGKIEHVKGIPIQKQTDSTKSGKNVTPSNVSKGALGGFLTKANQFLSRAVDFLAEPNNTDRSKSDSLTDSHPNTQLTPSPDQSSEVGTPSIQTQTSFSTSQILPLASDSPETNVNPASSPDSALKPQPLIQTQSASESEKTQSASEVNLGISIHQSAVQAQQKPDFTGTQSQIEKEFGQTSGSQSEVQTQFETFSPNAQPSDLESVTTPKESDAAIEPHSHTGSIQRSQQELDSKPESSTTKIQPLIEPFETQPIEASTTSVFRTIAEASESNPENTQSSIKESETQFEQTAGIPAPSIQKMESEPELQQAIAEPTSETSKTGGGEARSPIQDLKSEPKIQTTSEVEVSAQPDKFSTENTQPLVQRAEIAPEFPMELGTKESSAPVTANTANIQPSTQGLEFKPEIQTGAKGESIPEFPEVSTPKPEIQATPNQASELKSKIEPGTQTATREVVNSESVEVHVGEIQPLVEMLSSCPAIQKASEVGINFEPSELSSENSQLSIQKSELELTPQAERVDELDEAHSTKTKSQVTEIQPSIQRLETKPEFQLELEGESDSGLFEVSPIEIALLSQEGAKPEIQAASEPRVLPESATVHTDEPGIRAIDVHTESQRIKSESQTELRSDSVSNSVELKAADIQPVVQRSETEPKIQAEAESEFISDSVKFGALQPGIQTTATQAVVQGVEVESGIQAETAVEANIGSGGTRTVGTQPIIQKSEVEPQIQVITETGVISEPAKANAVEPEISAANIQSAVPRLEAKPELQTQPEVEISSEFVEVNQINAQPFIQPAKSELQLQMKPEAGIISKSIELCTNESEIQTPDVQPPIQEFGIEPATQVAAKTGVAPEAVESQATNIPSAIQKSEPELTSQLKSETEGNSEPVKVTTETIQPSVQRSEVEPEIREEPVVGSVLDSVEELELELQQLQPEREIRTNSKLIEVSTAKTQPLVQGAEVKLAIQQKPELIFTSEPATVRATEPKAQTIDVPQSTSDSEVQKQSEIKPISDLVETSAAELNTQTVAPQGPIQGPEIGPGSPENGSAKQTSSSTSLQVSENAAKEIQLSTQEATPQAEIEIQAANIQPSIQRLEVEPEFQTEPETRANFEPVDFVPEKTRPLGQETNTQPETQTALEAGAISEPAKIYQAEPKIQVTDIQPSVQKSEAESNVQKTEVEFQTKLEAEENSELVEINKTNIQPAFQKSEAKSELQNEEVRGAPNPVEIQAKDIRPSTQKLESESRIQAVEGDSISEPAIVSTTELETQTSAIQPSIHKSEAEIQKESEVGIVSQAAEPITPESHAQTTAIQPSIQKSGIESEFWTTAEVEAPLESDQVRSGELEIQTRTIQASTDVQASIQGLEAKPEFHMESEKRVSVEATEFQATEPEGQVTNPPSLIQRQEAKSGVRPVQESELNTSTFPAENFAVSDINAVEEATASSTASTGNNQADVVSTPPIDFEPFSQTSALDNRQQLQRQIDSNNLEKANRQPLHSSQHDQANVLQSNGTGLSNDVYPDVQLSEKVEGLNTSNSETAQKQSISDTPTTDFSVTTNNSEITVQRLPETENRSQHIPQLPQILQNLSVLQPLSQKQPSKKVNAPLIQTKGYINDSASSSFSSASTDSSSSRPFYPEVVIPAKAESSSSSSNSSTLNSNSLVGSTDVIPSAWSSLADLMDGQITSIQRSPAQNTLVSQSVTARDRSTAGQANTMIQAQSTGSAAPIQVTHSQPVTTVIAKKEETVAANEDSDETDYLELVTQVIYDRLKQRMRVEQERHGRGYSGRLPW